MEGIYHVLKFSLPRHPNCHCPNKSKLLSLYIEAKLARVCQEVLREEEPGQNHPTFIFFAADSAFTCCGVFLAGLTLISAMDDAAELPPSSSSGFFGRPGPRTEKDLTLLSDLLLKHDRHYGQIRRYWGRMFQNLWSENSPIGIGHYKADVVLDCSQTIRSRSAKAYRR